MGPSLLRCVCLIAAAGSTSRHKSPNGSSTRIPKSLSAPTSATSPKPPARSKSRSPAANSSGTLPGKRVPANVSLYQTPVAIVRIAAYIAAED